MPGFFIVEGVAGSGKDTLVQQVVAALQPDRRSVLAWDEAAVMASWHHYYLPGIDRLRLDLTGAILDEVAAARHREPDTAFVFNRFHVSHAVWRAERGNTAADLEARHHALVGRLAALGAVVLHPVLDPGEFDARTRHIERREAAWSLFLERRMRDMACTTPGQMYAAQQRMLQDVLARDGLPFHTLHVDPGVPLDLAPLLQGG